MPAKRPKDHDRGNDEDIVLSNTERWVIREVLSTAKEDKARLFVHKCEKNGLSLDDAKALADAFDLDIPEGLLDKYSPAC